MGFIEKHASQRKANQFMKGEKKKYYNSKNYNHNKNETTYASKGKEFIL
jgi:hypothetical protein